LGAGLEEAKAHLRTHSVKNNLAVINVSFDGQSLGDFDTQLKLAELRNKCDEIYSIAKKLFSNNEIYNRWRADIKDIERAAQRWLV
jgi:hypothetical protein